MPNVLVPIYLSDEDYVKYVKNKESIKKKARDLIKKEIE